MNKRQADNKYVCPHCHGSLQINQGIATCSVCDNDYRRHPDGFFDLRIDDTRYIDWLSQSDSATEQWLSGHGLTEATGAQSMMQRYFIPLLKKLELSDGAHVLSVGCGGGWDVDALHEAGFLAWGIDYGGRIVAWKDRLAVAYLSLSDALQLPFPDECFDFVFSEGVIEHIGFGGDTPHRHPDWRAQRVAFAESQLRVTRPGGYILVGCPNRQFPIDFFHGGRSFSGLQFRPHSPRELFLLSHGDIKDLFVEQAEWIKPLTLHNFFNLRRLAGVSRLSALASGMMETAGRWLPDGFWGTSFSPYLVVLIRKKG